MKHILLVGLGTLTVITFLSSQDATFDLKASITRGEVVYVNQCITCHMKSGEGIEGVYPPLAKSDYMMADKKRSIQQVLEGGSGPMTVNGVKYNGFMTPFNLTDKEASDVLNYIRNTWGNQGEAVKPEEVKAVRK